MYLDKMKINLGLVARIKTLCHYQTDFTFFKNLSQVEN